MDGHSHAASDAAAGRTPLLLHACCGPCSLEPVKYLRQEGFEPTICWTNPNIQPVREHDRRLAVLMAWAQDVAHGDGSVAADDRDAWEKGVAPKGLDRERRCRACYAVRLAVSCRVARERGFGFVSTTLAVSPYQLVDACHDELVSLAAAPKAVRAFDVLGREVPVAVPPAGLSRVEVPASGHLEIVWQGLAK